jgi:ADP-heptose:LPS heptosyltransferase
VAQGILVFRIGSLGDTLVAVPALRAVRAAYPGSPITWLCDRQVRQGYVLGSDVLRSTGLVDDFLEYPSDPRPIGRLLQPFRALRLLRQIRRLGFETLVYLVPSDRPRTAIARDRRFFGAAGIQNFIGFHGFPTFSTERPPGGFAEVPREADLLLSRLAEDGLAIPENGKADLRLPIGDAEREEVERWLSKQVGGGSQRWISLSPGCNQPAKRWPIDRYDAVIRSLIRRHDVWPVVFGGPQDANDARDLVDGWGRGAVAAGRLSLRAAIAAMTRCVMHIGNDTGTMHMAVAAGIPCVAVFSSRQLPGWWYPYGGAHRVLRTSIECENCQLFACIERRMRCILAITPERVLEACEEVLKHRQRYGAVQLAAATS